jgi:hypothetical protein
MSEVKAALTAEEWKEFLDPANAEWAPLAYHNRDGGHVTAAVALYGQPFGFTREDLALIDRVSRLMQAIGRGDANTEEAYDEAHSAFYALGRLAERISALLPPEEQG